MVCLSNCESPMKTNSLNLWTIVDFVITKYEFVVLDLTVRPEFRLDSGSDEVGIEEVRIERQAGQTAEVSMSKQSASVHGKLFR